MKQYNKETLKFMNNLLKDSVNYYSDILIDSIYKQAEFERNKEKEVVR